MTTPNHTPWLELTQIDATAIVMLPAGNLYHDEELDVIGEDLRRLIETSQFRHLVLDFQRVDHVSSELVSILLVVKKRLAMQGGRLTLCALNADLFEAFATLRLDQVFTIVGTERDTVGGPAM